MHACAPTCIQAYISHTHKVDMIVFALIMEAEAGGQHKAVALQPLAEFYINVSFHWD